MTNRPLAKVLTLSLVLLSVACTRKVAVESEPNPFQSAASEIEMVGAYDYRVDIGGGQIVTGTMNVTRPGGAYAVALTSSMGGIDVRSVERRGSTLIVETNTPGGAATMELDWSSADRFSGLAFLGGTAYLVEGSRND